MVVAGVITRKYTVCERIAIRERQRAVRLRWARKGSLLVRLENPNLYMSFPRRVSLIEEASREIRRQVNGHGQAGGNGQEQLLERIR
jgi:hypothetical protein